MSTELTTTNRTNLALAGQAANDARARAVFADYQQRKSSNSLRAQYADLSTFTEYLCAAGVECPTPDELQNTPEAWEGITHGLIAGFVQWMLLQGLALPSVNRKLSTVKVYAGLAATAGIISGADLALIETVKGYAAKEFKRVDEKRASTGSATRTGAKKAQSTVLTSEQAKALKQQPDTPQGRRDAVIMCLLLDHGLRVGELAALQVDAVDLKAGQLRFYRPKVGKTQTHNLSRDSKAALKAYMSYDAPAMKQQPLLRSSRKNGELYEPGMNEQNITLRVGELGRRLGIDNLSAHDCRHYWATQAVRSKDKGGKGVDPFQLMHAGGWTSMQTVSKYVDASKIANDGFEE